MDGKYSFARTLTGDLFLQTYANIRGARERGEVSLYRLMAPRWRRQSCALSMATEDSAERTRVVAYV
eukprot:scaffold5615_cov136-Skeletonema_menzelii.AAC.3